MYVFIIIIIILELKFCTHRQNATYEKVVRENVTNKSLASATLTARRNNQPQQRGDMDCFE